MYGRQVKTEPFVSMNTQKMMSLGHNIAVIVFKALDKTKARVCSLFNTGVMLFFFHCMAAWWCTSLPFSLHAAVLWYDSVLLRPDSVLSRPNSVLSRLDFKLSRLDSALLIQ